jgi:carbamoyl-phosphate synthase/aspartate carbamoyltransferase
MVAEGLKTMSEMGPDALVRYKEIEEIESSKVKERRLEVELAHTSDYVPKSISQALNQSPFFRKHILSVKQFTRSELHLLFSVAQELRTLVERQGTLQILSGKVLCSAFWEPSTRTSCSFETAMVRLGGHVVNVNQITSSIAKGESIADTGGCFFLFFF